MQKINWMRSKIQEAKIYQGKAFDEINGLVIKERQGKKIILRDGRMLTEFVSCSYLGLDQDQRLMDAISQNIDKFGVSFHAARTRIQPESNLELEARLNDLYQGAFSITFPAIHMAHLGFLPLLCSGETPSFPIATRGGVFIVDKTAHSSIQINRGLLEQFGQVVLTNFQQLDTVTNLVQATFKQKKTPVLIGDSVGSMGGIAPITELLALADKFNGYVYLDDAHGTSVHGKHGSGYVLKLLNNQFHPRLIITATLGKAFGVMGGVLLLPTFQDVEFTKKFSPTYVFGGPLALPVVNAAIASAKIHLTDEIYTLQKSLWENVDYFDSLMFNCTINLNTPSPIRGIFVGDEFKAIEITKELRRRGFDVTTALYPTVPKQTSILRAALSAIHEKNDILQFCNHTKEILSSHVRIFDDVLLSN